MENFITLLEQAKLLAPGFALGLASIIPFIILSILIKFIFRKISNKKTYSSKRHIILFIAKLLQVVIWIIAIITALGTFGIDVSAIIAGLGLTGFALGFALKDVLSSSIAGAMIMLYQPFKLNDRISVMGITGKVINIDMRYATLQNEDGTHLIPNSKLISEKVSIIG